MTVTWTVTPVGYQHIAKRCPACNVKRDFAPSGAIRVNSQKKLLDIWSIYKCTHCDYTWNIALFSRLHVSKINRKLLQRLMQNDAAMVHYYAADLATLKRNGAEPSGQPDFRIHEQWSVTLMAQRIWSCGCLPGSDCQVSSAEGGFRLTAVTFGVRLNDR